MQTSDHTLISGPGRATADHFKTEVEHLQRRISAPHATPPQLLTLLSDIAGTIRIRVGNADWEKQFGMAIARQLQGVQELLHKSNLKPMEAMQLAAEQKGISHLVEKAAMYEFGTALLWPKNSPLTSTEARIWAIAAIAAANPYPQLAGAARSSS